MLFVLWASLALGVDASAELSMLLQRMEKLEARAAQTDKLEARVAQLEEENARLKSNKRLAATDLVSMSVDASGARSRRLSHSAADGCCRWSADNACGANVSWACTKLHEYAENSVATVVFEDVGSCPGANPSMGFDPLTAEVTLKADGSEVARKPTPLKVTHPADCASPSTVQLQLNTSVEGDLSVEGQLTVNGGVSDPRHTLSFCPCPKTHSSHSRCTPDALPLHISATPLQHLLSSGPMRLRR